jgi:hypothetical protein
MELLVLLAFGVGFGLLAGWFTRSPATFLVVAALVVLLAWLGGWAFVLLRAGARLIDRGIEGVAARRRRPVHYSAEYLAWANREGRYADPGVPPPPCDR